jgi:hypothetical protein
MYAPYTHFAPHTWGSYAALWDTAGRCVAPSLFYGQYTHYTVSASLAVVGCRGPGCPPDPVHHTTLHHAPTAIS